MRGWTVRISEREPPNSSALTRGCTPQGAGGGRAATTSNGSGRVSTPYENTVLRCTGRNICSRLPAEESAIAKKMGRRAVGFLMKEYFRSCLARKRTESSRRRRADSLTIERKRAPRILLLTHFHSNYGARVSLTGPHFDLRARAALLYTANLPATTVCLHRLTTFTPHSTHTRHNHKLSRRARLFHPLRVP